MKKSHQAILLGAVIMCAVFTCVTIAWAAFSTTLTIGGTATVKAQTWNIFFASASVDTTNTTAKNVSIDNIGSSTNTITISNLAASYNVPGQKAVYNLTVKSTSTFDAKLTAYGNPTIECSSTTSGTTKYNPSSALTAYNAITNGDYSTLDSAERVCAFMSYEYVVGSTGFNGVAMGTTTAAGQTMSSLVNSLVLDNIQTTSADSDIDTVLTIYFDKDKTMNQNALPTEDVTVTFKDLKLTFTQA